MTELSIEILLASLIPLVALLADLILGEPKRFHPLVGFGAAAKYIEACFNKFDSYSERVRKFTGLIAWSALCIPLPVLAYFVLQELSSSYFFLLFEIVVLYLAVGLKSLNKHAQDVFASLSNNDIIGARKAVSMMVSRKTDELDESEVSRATIESVLENGNDAVISSLFWFAIGGAPLVIMHRLSNTLDAMWGYRSKRFNSFGRFSAKMDDFMAWPGAKLSSIFYLVLSKKKELFATLRMVSKQANRYKSLNGGWTISAGAFGLGVSLGGKAVYPGQKVKNVTLGKGIEPCKDKIEEANLLVCKSARFFALSYFLVSLLILSLRT